MLGRSGTLDEIVAVRIQLFFRHAEVVVDRRPFEDTLFHATPLANLVVPHLHNHGEALYEEDATENGEQQLLVDDDGADTDDTETHEAGYAYHQ